MRRVRLDFAGLKVEFCNRGIAIKQVEDFAERGTWHPIVVFGPEGCGKTAWLKQAAETLRELGFEAIYIDPMRRDFIAHTDVEELVKKLAEAASETVGIAEVKLATLAIDAVKQLISRWRRGRVAILVDDVFQAIGLDKAARYVKALLGLVEYPPEGYEKIVAIAATSEGVTRREIGRHRWATIKPMWNMGKKGFEELYEKIPNPKPSVNEAWRLTGGNPEMLARLYEVRWDVDVVVAELIRAKELTKDFVKKWGTYLKKVVEDPQNLWEEDFPNSFREELIAKNLIVYNIYDRDTRFWIDEPPPEKDLELGIGKDVAWQTPIHREAVKRAMA